MYKSYNKEEIRQLVEEKYKAYEIESKTGITGKTLYFYLKELGIKTPKGFYSIPIEQKKILTKICKNKLLEYIKKGLTCFDIMKLEKVCQPTVSNLIRRYELKKYIKSGFYTTGKKIGRPKGIPMSEDRKQKNRIFFSSKGNPMYGKKHTNKTKEKMSLNHADVNGNKNPFKKSLNNSENLAKLKQRRRDFWASKDEQWMKNWKSKMSEIIANSEFVKNNSFNKYHDNGHVSTKKAGEVFCRSSWEKKMCCVLDDCDLVNWFTLEKFTIPYVDENSIKRRTRIDFLMELNNGKKIMVEIKPESLLSINHNAAKIIGCKNYCEQNGIIFKHMGDYYFPKNIERIIEYIKEIYDNSRDENK